MRQQNQWVHISYHTFGGKKRLTDAINKFLLGETKHCFDIWNKETLENELAIIKTAVRSEKAQQHCIKLLLSIIVTMFL